MDDWPYVQALYVDHGSSVFAHLRRLAPRDLAGELTVRVFVEAPRDHSPDHSPATLADLLRNARRQLAVHYTRPEVPGPENDAVRRRSCDRDD